MKLANKLAQALRDAWQAILRERAAARTRRNLHALSDHMLRDIGLDRSRIDSLLDSSRSEGRVNPEEVRMSTRRVAAARFALGAMLSVLLVSLALMPGSAQGIGPDQLIKRITSDVLTSAHGDRDIRAGDTAKIYALVEMKILPYFDSRRATRVAMGPDWRRATPAQQARLVKEFRTLLVRTYSGALASYRDQTIDFLPLRAQPGDTEVTVRSRVKQPGTEPIVIAYDLEKTGDDWKVFDIRVGGVSLVATYRTSFAEVVREQGIDGLIGLLASKNRESAKHAPVGS